ncbi:hypothetical protein M409DRAFT_48977 [Zasmidium cellare ATCC 36951]|uniref:SMP-30/Gluconolactonase/LRE-like region domain-containing protein n=1 Tax=Zasmidium cellare ATCC 36951 TaxID=1080233 RepID=A0A6A6D7F3_ZASCE|nr:uncharacterized protein M409DRAFT_48977 [Zasmidium cellare ATCC 36951]KAF2174099.1 hypothetical protein M409DRAFT_48977 [Zasmidium cellare ATCC 36951]
MRRSDILRGISALGNIIHVSGAPLISESYDGLYRHDGDAVHLLHQFPLGTWVENIAVRKSGKLLLTLATTPELTQLDPLHTDAGPETVYRFPDASSLTGIAEIEHDVFVAAVGNFSISEGKPQAGSWSVWNIDLSQNHTSGSNLYKITDLPELVFPNGVCSLPYPSSLGPRNILAGDLGTGKIWRVDTTVGTHQVVIDDQLTTAVPNPLIGLGGVDGIHVRDGILYFTNTGLGIFARVPINLDGTPSGSARTITHVLNATLQFDDFALSPNGEDVYLVTGSGNSIERLGLDSRSKGKIIAGNVNSTQIAEPTSCAFGRTESDWWILYVVTGGGLAVPVNGNERVWAQVLAVDTRQWSQFTDRTRAQRIGQDERG